MTNPSGYRSAIPQGLSDGQGLPQGPESASSFSPGDDLVDIVNWYRADLGVTLNVSDVATWADQVGTDDVSATGVQQPAYNSSNSNFNNKPTITFGGDSTENLTSASFTTLTQPFFGMIVQTNEGSGGGGFGRLIADNGVSGKPELTVHDSIIEIEMNAGTSQVSTGDALPASATVPNVITFVFNGASSVLWVDGVPAISGVDPGAEVWDTAGIIIGNRSDLTRRHDGEIAEIVVCNNSLSLADHNSLGEYAASRYGTTWTTIT